jgi:hypothetical protein
MLGDELVEAASVQGGLKDVGADTFREGLEQLVASLDDEAQLSDIGRVALESQIVTNLVNRLKVTDWVSRHPAVRDERIERPVFILGLPRTGTTLLSYLLAQDAASRSLMRWEAMSSVPPPHRDAFDSDPRIAEARDGQVMLDALNPGFKAIHYEAPDGPTECVAVFSQDFKSVLWETVANVPSYGEWLNRADYTSAYAYHRQVLQLLQSDAPGRWMLKSPGHCLALDALLATYPDASFIVTHRDPIAVVASTCSLVNSLSGTFSDADHREYVAQHWPAVLVEMTRRVDDFRDRHPDLDGRFFDLPYDQLVADPVAAARRIYDHMGTELTADVESAMAAYAADNRQGKYGRHSYTLDELGLDRGQLDEQFAAYRARHDIPRPREQM